MVIDNYNGQFKITINDRYFEPWWGEKDILVVPFKIIGLIDYWLMNNDITASFKATRSGTYWFDIEEDAIQFAMAWG